MVMDKVLLSTLPRLDNHQRLILRRGNVNTVADLILTSPNALAKKCNVSLSDITQLIRVVCNNQGDLGWRFQTPEDLNNSGEQTFSIGDSILDDALGGGFKPGMVWEIVGESAAGKTQFALQSSLYVQLPLEEHGLGGSACYLTTSTKLQTSRLLQIQQERNVAASLENIHTLSTPTVQILLNVLENQLPGFIEKIAKSHPLKPVKLLIIDALAELFHSFERVTTATLVERSQHLTQISAHLHQLANRYKIAVLVLNEVVDTFDNYAVDSASGEKGLLVYTEQARWFNRAHSVYGENRKEASLGLAWANQVNARIMLTRTGRRRYIDEGDAEEKDKRRKTQGEEETSRSGAANAEEEPMLIRRLTVVFNSVGTLNSCDYIVTSAGVKGLSSEDRTGRRQELQSEAASSSSVGSATGADAQLDNRASTGRGQEEDYEGLWTDDEFYENIDWDQLEQTLSQSQPN